MLCVLFTCVCVCVYENEMCVCVFYDILQKQQRVLRQSGCLVRLSPTGVYIRTVHFQVGRVSFYFYGGKLVKKIALVSISSFSNSRSEEAL